MKKQTKIITLVLTCLLLIGAVVGITVSAEETAPTVTIAGQNISYEGAVRVAYYVSTENLGDNSIKMLVSDAAFEIPANVNNPGDGVAVTDVTDSITIDGRGTYSLGYSEGVVPKELRVNIYAVAVVVSEDGTVVANSNKKLYSPYTYAMNRFSQNPGADQLNLYTSLLNYGAAVQGVLMTEDEVLAAGGWADEYFVLKHNTITDGGEPVAANVSYRGLEVNALSVEHAAPKWQGDNKNVIFAGYTDADGNAFYGENYAANWNKVTLTPGYTVLDSNYVTDKGQYESYDFGTTFADNNAATDITGTTVGTDKWAIIAGDENNGYINYGKAVSGQATVRLQNQATLSSGKIGEVYVADFDFAVNNTGNASDGAHIGQFWLDASVNSTHLWGVNVYGYPNVGFTLKVDGGSDSGAVASNQDVKFAYNTWHNFRIEYYPWYDGMYTQLVKFYIDGVLFDEYTGIYGKNVSEAYGHVQTYMTEAVNYYGLTFNMNSASTGTTFMIDNAYTGIVEKDFELGQGYYANLYGGVNTYEDVSTSADVGWTTVNSFGKTPATYAGLSNNYTTNSTGYSWTAIETEDGNSSVNVGKVASYNTSYTEYYKSTNTPGNQPVIPATDNTGSIYVFETDFRVNHVSDIFWSGSALVTDKWFVRIEFNTTASGAGSEKAGNILLYCDANGNVCVGNSTTVVGEVGNWFNLRIEVTPLGIDASGNYKYELQAFVNGELVYYKTYQTTSGTVDNRDFTGISLETRGYALDASYSMDNTFVSAVGYRSDNTIANLAPEGVIDYSTNNSGYETTAGAATRRTQNADNTYTVNSTWATVVQNGATAFPATWSGLNQNESSYYLKVADEYLQLGKSNTSVVKARYPLAEAGGAGDTYVFSTEFAVLSTKNAFTSSAGDDLWVTKLALSGDTETDYFFAVYAYVEGTNVVLKTGKNAEPLAVIPMQVWMSVCIKYTPTGVNDGTYGANVKIYVNNDLVSDTDVTTNKDNTAYTRSYVELRGYVSDIVIGLDDTYVGLSADNRGNGDYADAAESFSGETGNWTTDVASATSRVNIANNYALNTSKENLTSGINIYFANDDMTMGGTHAFELDFKLAEKVVFNAADTDGWSVKFGLHNYTNSEILCLFAYPVNSNGKLVSVDGGDAVAYKIARSASATPLAIVPADEWHSLRVELTPDSYVASTSPYTGTAKFYVDGELCETAEGYYYSANTSNNIYFKRAFIEVRGKATTAGITVDNVYCDEINVDTTGEIVHDFDNGDTVEYITSSDFIEYVTDENGNVYLNISSYMKDNTPGTYTTDSSKYPEGSSAPYANANTAYNGDGTVKTYNSSLTYNATNVGARTFMICDNKDSLLQAQVGSFYQLDFDMRVNSLENWFLNTSNGNVPFGLYIGATAGKSGMADGDIEAASLFTSFNPGTLANYVGDGWLDIKYIVYVTGVVDDTSVTVLSELYVNGSRVATGKSKTITKCAIDDINAFMIKINKTTTSSYGGLTDYHIDFDNFKVTAHNTVARTDLADGTLAFDFEDGEQTWAGTGLNASVAGDDDNKYLNIQNPASGEQVINFTDSSNALGDPTGGDWGSPTSYEYSYRIRVNAMGIPASQSSYNNWWVNASVNTTATYAEGIAAGSENGDASGVFFDNSRAFTYDAADEDDIKGSVTLANANIGDGQWHDVKVIINVTAITDTAITFNYSFVIDGVETASGTATRAGTDIQSVSFKFKSASAITYSVDLDDITVKSYNAKNVTAGE